MTRIFKPMYFDGSVHIEEDDQCYSCEYFLKGVTCPLLEALGVGVAHLDGDVTVRNCGFYKEFKRHLQVVEPPIEFTFDPDVLPQTGQLPDEPEDGDKNRYSRR